jgi:hypothetical protein
MTSHEVAVRTGAQTAPDLEKFALTLKSMFEAQHRLDAGFANYLGRSGRSLRTPSTWRNAFDLRPGNVFDVHAAIPVVDTLWTEFSRRVEQQFVISSLSASLTFLYDRSSRLETEIGDLRRACISSERSLGSRLSSLEGLLGVSSEALNMLGPAAPAETDIPDELYAIPELLDALGGKLFQENWLGTSSQPEYDDDLGGRYLAVEAKLRADKKEFAAMRNTLLRSFAEATQGRDISKLVLSVIRDY